MNSKKIPADISKKSIKEAQSEIKMIIEKLENDLKSKSKVIKFSELANK